MPEVESLHIVDGTTEPFREIAEVNIAFAVAILDLQKFEQIVVLDRVVGSKMLHKVLNRHLSIEILIEGQEGESDFLELRRDFFLDLRVKCLDLVSQLNLLLCIVLSVKPFLLLRISVFIRLGLLFQNMELGEENLAELVKAHSVRWYTIFHGADD